MKHKMYDHMFQSRPLRNADEALDRVREIQAVLIMERVRRQLHLPASWNPAAPWDERFDELGYWHFLDD